MNNLSHKQIKLIHLIKNSLKWSEEKYRSILKDVTDGKKTTSKNLTQEEFGRFYNRAEAEGFQFRISDETRRTIYRIWDQILYKTYMEKTSGKGNIYSFLEQVFKVKPEKGLRNLTEEDGRRIKRGLSAYLHNINKGGKNAG